MAKSPDYYIVEASVLPEIFHKVVEARRLLDTGEADTVNKAVEISGISRSAFYKYKDTVRPFQDTLRGRIINFQVMLKDQPGNLSAVLNLLAGSGGNILTINQGIPTNGCAVVNVAVESQGMKPSIQELLQQLSAHPGVLKSEILAG